MEITVDRRPEKRIKTINLREAVHSLKFIYDDVKGTISK